MRQFLRDRELEAKLIAKAWKDPEFKKSLIRDPRTTLREFGFDLPNDLRINVVEDTPTSYTLAIPCCPAGDKSLSSEELLRLAGGSTPGSTPGFMADRSTPDVDLGARSARDVNL